MIKLIPRPKFLNTNARKFLDLYLDPLNSIEHIAYLCGLKKSSIYNYQKELNIPIVKVGLGTRHYNLPQHKAISAISDPYELYDLSIVRRISYELSIRIKIVPLQPCLAIEVGALKRKDVDFVVSCMTKTHELNQAFYCSEEYFSDSGPYGVFVCDPKNALQAQSRTGRKLLVGAVEKSIHAQYADKHLYADHKIKKFSSEKNAIISLKSGNIDFLLIHPSCFNYFPTETEGLRIFSNPFYYSTHSCLTFHADSQQLVGPINSVLDKILSN